MLHDLNIEEDYVPAEQVKKRLLELSEAGEPELDEISQEEAVIQAVNSGLLIITGGPGTGKTTTINTIIRYFEEGRPGNPAGGSHRAGCEADVRGHGTWRRRRSTVFWSLRECRGRRASAERVMLRETGRRPGRRLSEAQRAVWRACILSGTRTNPLDGGRDHHRRDVHGGHSA